MFSSNFVSVLQLIVSPLFFAMAAVAPAFLTMALARLFAAQRRLARTHRLLIEVDFAEHCVELTGEPDHKGRTSCRGPKSGVEQKPGDDEKEEFVSA